MKRGDVSAAIRHDLLRALRENIALAVCGCFVLLILIPFSTAAIPGDSVFDVSVTHEQMKFRFIADGFVPAVLIAAVLFGFLFGIASFRFVLDSGRAQTLFSFGISRVRLCFNRFASGAVLIAAAIFVPMTVSLALNLAALGNYPGLFTAWIWLWAGLFVTATAAFCVASIGCLLAGTLPEALFFGAALYAGPYAISYAAGVFLKQLLWGNPFGVAPYLGPGPLAPSATELFSFLNPALFFYDDLASHRMFYRPLETDIPDPISPAVLLAWIAATVVLALLALRLMRRRRAEQAGFAWKCPAALHVCAFVPTVFAGAFVFGLAADASLLFGVALGLVVVALCFLLTQRPLASAGAASFRFLPVAVKIALILLLAVGAKVGYGSYLSLPSIGNVASVDVSYVGAPNALAVPAYGSSSSTDYYFSASYTYTSDSDVERSLDAHRAFAETGRRALRGGGKDFGDTVVPYDIRFTYALKDGREKTWYYDRASFAQLRRMLAFDETDEVSAAEGFAMGGAAAADAAREPSDEAGLWAREAYLNGEVYLADPSFREIFSLNLTAEARAELLACLRADRAAQTSEERYFPDREALAVLMFTFDGESDLQSFSYHLNNAFVFADAAYEKTLAFLKAGDLWFDRENDNRDVAHILLQPYDPYIGMNAPTFPQSPFFMSYRSDRADDFRVLKDFGTADEVRDPAEKERALAGMRSFYYLSEPGYLAAIQYEGSDRWVYKFLPDGETDG